jgi:anthranilate synthase/aminodeoxychorismate synthase-like glutamine amidotransferase
MKVLLVDNYDSFTFNLLHLLELAGAECKVVRNDDQDFDWRSPGVDAAVLSPGPCTPREAGWLMDFIEHHAGKLPLLGICLGHQALGMHFGARLVRAPRPVHGKVSRMQAVADPWFEQTGLSFEAMRYHSLVLEELPDELLPLAWSEEGCLMAFRHKSFPVYGLQFHPESVLSHCGQQLIDAFVRAQSPIFAAK